MGTLHVAHWTSSSLVYMTRTSAGLIQSRTLGSSGLTLSPGSIGFGVDVLGGVHFTRRLGATRGLGYIHRPPCP